MKLFPVLFLVACSHGLLMNSCDSVLAKDDIPSTSTKAIDPVNGVTLVAPPKPFTSDPILEIVDKVSANWIAVIPYAYTPPQKPEVIYRQEGPGWWGEKPEGVRRTLELAKARDMKVMLKPQVWSWGWWSGEYDFDSDEDWRQWEEQYSNYILSMADIAAAYDIDAFVIGTEFKNAIAQRPQFWTSLIDSVRNHYDGALTYSANWDNYQNIPFWSKLDAIGVSAYFPLVESATPAVNDLKKAWIPIVDQLRAYADKEGRKICFTEIGYMSVDHAAWKTWENEANVYDLAINEQAQANAYQAYLEVFSEQEWWLGSFIWKWFPGGQGGEGYDEKDYTPQNKAAEKVLKKAYSQRTR